MKSYVTIFFLFLILLRVEKVLSLESIDHQSNPYYVYALTAGTFTALCNGMVLLIPHRWGWGWGWEVLFVFEQAGGVIGLLVAGAAGASGAASGAAAVAGAGVGLGVVYLLGRQQIPNF